MQDLKNIIAPIEMELQEFKAKLHEVLQSKVDLVNKIIEYTLTQKPKYIRPILVLLSAKALGQVNSVTIQAAALVEILHTATLVHDDVVDESFLRRGQPSINAVWQNKIAVLFGDYLFSKSLQLILEIENKEALRLIGDTTIELSEGELLQLEYAISREMGEETYYRMIWAKTASLFATSCQLGAMTVNASKENCRALYEYGGYLGMAFQIKDDLFDLVGADCLIGKPIGRDLKSNLLTLPLIYTLRIASPKEAEEIKHRLKTANNPENLEWVKEQIIAKGGINYTEQKLNEYSEKALAVLASLPDNPCIDALKNLVMFNTTRTR